MQKDNAFIFNTVTTSSLKGELEPISEKRIWKAIKEGDTSALGALYDLYIDDLFTYGMYHAQDRSYIMDCIHDLFLDLYKYRLNLFLTDNIKYYLFKSLKRKINKKYRVKDQVLPIYFEHSKGIDDIGKQHSISHEEAIIDSECALERSTKVAEAMKTLTKKQRKCLRLRFDEEKTYEEISEIMGITIQTARTTVYRAIKILRASKFNLDT